MKQKTRIWITPLIVMGLLLMLTNSCKKTKDDANTVKDIDGNVYHTISIGTLPQVWMVENLQTTTYNDGLPITLVASATTWSARTLEGYCWYNNDAANYKTTYGAIYNWYAVNTGKLCPTGWHVPSDAEWTILTNYLGGETIAGGKMKAISTLWASPNTGASNSSGFKALPAGYRQDDGSFYNINDDDYWWSSTQHSTQLTKAWARDVNYNYAYVSTMIYVKSYGYSVRCLKDGVALPAK